MSQDRDAADLDQVTRKVLLLQPTPTAIPPDDLTRRLAQALADPRATDLDIAVLVRQVLLRARLRVAGHIRPVPVAPQLSARLRPLAARCSLREPEPDLWFAEVWRPDWLDTQADTPDSPTAGRPHDPSADQTPNGPPAADPFFTRITGYPTYRTPGQQAAVRAVICAPAGSTTIALLPTGSGKTEVALCLASARKSTVTLLIVPTIALAHDFQRRLRDFYRRRNPRFDISTEFAWTHETDPETREAIRNRIVIGTQPILVTSPESMTRALRETVITAATAGRLQGLVIDEAHLVTQWGRSFRPEFRTLQSLRETLICKAEEANHPPLRTLLLSATLGPEELEDLGALFGEPGPCTLVAANALRPEPRIWVNSAPDTETRSRRISEALAHLPRPAILYTTAPDKAEGFATALRAEGYARIATVTGRTGGNERADVLAGIRTETDGASRFDLVIATSAFGLGIDYPHVRSVLHACLPETIDRWYQEIGRGGRDGEPSTAMLIGAPRDDSEAASLTTKLLTAQTAQERWEHLWDKRVSLDNRSFVDLHSVRGAIGEGDYNWRWNAQLVQGLHELHAVDRRTVERDELRSLLDSRADAGEQDWVEVDLQIDLQDKRFWTEEWEPWRTKEWRNSDGAFRQMLTVIAGDTAFCTAVAAAYRPDEEANARYGSATTHLEPMIPCGQCPSCRTAGIMAGGDPPPRPPQRWPVDLPRPHGLHKLVGALGNPEGLVILTCDEPTRTARTLCTPLLEAGVRHLSGITLEVAEKFGWIFMESTFATPRRLTPVPHFGVLPAGDRIDPTWWARAPRRAHRPDPDQAVDILLVSADTRLPTQEGIRSAPASLALTILQGA